MPMNTSYTDFGAFAPSESAFVNPGEYEAVQRSVALQKATYLSSMDQFYADLEERGREFDATLAFEKDVEKFKEKAWMREFRENRKQFKKQAKLKQQEIGLGYRAQSSQESNDMFGNILGGVGLFDSIGGFEFIGDLF